MFKASLSEAGLFKSLLSSLSTVIDDAIFNLKKEGISLKAIDSSKVVAVHLFIAETAFEDYVCENDNKICFSIKEVCALLKSTKNREPIDFSYSEESNKFEIKVFGEYERHFVIPTFSFTEEEEIPLPQISFNTKFRIVNQCFRNIVEDISTVSEEVNITSFNDKIVFMGMSEKGEVNLTLSLNSESLLNLALIEESESKYGIKLLSDIVKASLDASEIATIEFSTALPIRIDFDLPNNGKLIYYIAPMIT